MSKTPPILGFIGQGYVGKALADDFEERGFSVIRYAKEAPYNTNGQALQNAEIVFIAVPTPTVGGKFTDSILRSVFPLLKKGTIAVIKSTVLPGTTESIQKQFPKIIVMHSPEFLSEKTALADTRAPRRNIIGIAQNTPLYRAAAKKVLALLPQAPYDRICTAREAELIKYANNTFLYTKVVYMNALYDAAQALKIPWDVIRDAMAHEPWIGPMHIQPVHKSGRGAGGACFVKDFAAFRSQYEALLPKDRLGKKMLRAIEAKNVELLTKSKKDLHQLRVVYSKRRRHGTE